MAGRKIGRTEFEKKLEQMYTRLDEELQERILAAAAIQEHRPGQLIRILIQWALPFYESVESVEALMALEMDEEKFLRWYEARHREPSISVVPDPPSADSLASFVARRSMGRAKRRSKARDER